MLRFLLLLLAVLAGGSGYWLHRRGHALGVLLAGASAFLGVSFAITGLWASGQNLDRLENLATDFDHCAGQVLGNTLAKKYPGARVLVLQSPDAGSSPRAAVLLDGLRAGLGDDMKWVGTRVPRVPASYREELEREVSAGKYEAEMVPMALANYTLWFTSRELAKLMDEFATEADLVIATLALPPASGKPGWPALALANAPVRHLRSTIESGTLATAVTWLPDPRSWQAVTRMPADLQKQFDLRFLLITSDNVAGLDRQHPNLFEDPR